MKPWPHCGYATWWGERLLGRLSTVVKPWPHCGTKVLGVDTVSAIQAIHDYEAVAPLRLGWSRLILDQDPDIHGYEMIFRVTSGHEKTL